MCTVKSIEFEVKRKQNKKSQFFSSENHVLD